MKYSVEKEVYDRDGYVVVPDLFTQEEVLKFKAEIKHLLDMVDQGQIPAKNNQYKKTGVFVGLAANSTLFHEVAKHEKMVAILKKLIGDHIVFLSDKVVFKSASINFGSPWHQDWPYWQGSHKISVWIALDPADKENGCLKVIPGSHLQGELQHTGDASDGRGFGNRLDADKVDESKATALEIGSGGVVFFHDLLFHASYPNISSKDRYTLISTYKDGDSEDPEYSWATAAFRV